MERTIIGLFHEAERVKRATDMLENGGYDPSALSIIMKDTSNKRFTYLPFHESAEKIVSGTAVGVIVGGLAGFIVFGLAGFASNLLLVAACGGVVGGFISTLYLRRDTHYYESLINEGAILLAIPLDPDKKEMTVAVLHAAGAFDIMTFNVTAEKLIKNYDIESALDRGAFSLQYMYPSVGVKGGKTKKRDKSHS